MIKTTVSVNGMACSMCEAHINDAIRAAFPVRKVTSSHTKKETVILSDEKLDHEAIKPCATPTRWIAFSHAAGRNSTFFLEI